MRIIPLALLSLLLLQPLTAADTSAVAAEAVKAGEQAKQTVAVKAGEQAKDETKDNAEEEEPDCD